MTVFEDENDLAGCLREMLAPKFKEVYANVNLASHRFYADWEKWWGESAPVAQPQVDLIFVSSDLKLLAVELKYYRPGKNSLAHWPYYAGIDEALALLKFGFTCVSLWHFFDAEVPDDLMRSYVRDCYGLTVGLGLRINYKAFRVHGRQESDIKEIAPMSKSEVQAIFSPYGTSNPLLDNLYAKKAADFIRKALRIPSP
jgi:hypothetical protein